MAQKWPKIAKMALKLPKMAQKLAPAKNIAEIYLQYLQLFASLQSNTPTRTSSEAEESDEEISSMVRNLSYNEKSANRVTAGSKMEKTHSSIDSQVICKSSPSRRFLILKPLQE